MIRYLIHPGTVTSKTDKLEHFISYSSLAGLYNVPIIECLNADDEARLSGYSRSFIDTLLHLYPKQDGDYTLPLLPKLLHILQHSLGLDSNGKCRDAQYTAHHPYRNNFATGPEGDDFALCNELVALGLMQDHGIFALSQMHHFTVTPEGMDAVIRNSPTPPKITRSQVRYRDWLNSDSGLSFPEWLRGRP